MPDPSARCEILCQYVIVSEIKPMFEPGAGPGDRKLAGNGGTP